MNRGELKRTEPSKLTTLLICVAGPLFLSIGAGVLTFLGVERHGVRTRPYDLQYSAEVSLGVFVMCLIISCVSLALRRARSRGQKP